MTNRSTRSIIALAAIALATIALASVIGRYVMVRPAGESGGTAPPTNIYVATGKNALSAVAMQARPLVYVPNSRAATVTVIDPKTYKVVRTFKTGALPQHVVPSYDLKTLWVANNKGYSLTPIDPVTGEEGSPVAVDDPYNLYFTPDGRFAMVVAEKLNRIDFRDAHDMTLVQSVPVACSGVDHMEFTSDGRYAIATCELSGQLVKIDLSVRTVVGYLSLSRGTATPEKKMNAAGKKGHASHAAASMPQDIRSSPDGTVFYVADMKSGGIFLVDPIAFTQVGFIETGVGPHGLYPSRDGTQLYVTNRGWTTVMGGHHGPGSIAVLDFATRKIVATWSLPRGGSPDMGNVTADGSELWISGRYDDEVYVFDTTTGALKHRIPVGREPHGLCVWPQPGRYSLGHTGNMR
jgi:YVTN family beta-propeller protein